VLKIREMRLSGKKYNEISDNFSISFYHVRRICKNKSWKHVPLGEECERFISSYDYNQRQHHP
jgi:DNA invertase Pin-like site-specific DNA recombinase